MRSFEEIQALLQDVETASGKRSEARHQAGNDAAAAQVAATKADQSNTAANEAQSALVSAVQAVNEALAEIVNGDDQAVAPRQAARPTAARGVPVRPR